MFRPALPSLAALPPLAACGPMPVDQAEKLCVEQANLASRPRGRIALGAGSGARPVGALDVTISSDFILGRDPAQVFETCVKARSGKFPIRMLDDQPDWVG
ncbi:MAG: hypothetical protein K9G43_06865 [Rhodobacteraceae bacterium]|nr:hypothetical protein [Paracoccaceae bacterium]